MKALSKLRDIDYLSFKMFKMLTKTKSQNVEEEKGTAESHAKEIKKNYAALEKAVEGGSIPAIIKRFEFFIFGALSAYQNKHFRTAFAFINQAPILALTQKKGKLV